MLAVYAIVNGNDRGWGSIQTLGLLAAAAALLGIFLVIEARISFPLVPLGLFRNRNVSSANVAGALMAAGLFSYFFFSALYLQLVLEYTPLEVGLAYLPGTIIWGASSLLLSDRLVMRFGIKPPLLTGLSLMVLALLLLARTPVDGNWAIDILPATIAIGIGAGIAFNPILLAAMSGVAPDQAGLASGVVNTAFMMGGAVGLAILASLADSRTREPARFGPRLPRGPQRRLPPRVRRRRRLPRRLGCDRCGTPPSRGSAAARGRDRRSRSRRGRLAGGSAATGLVRHKRAGSALAPHEGPVRDPRQRGDAAADAGRARDPALARLARALAHARRACGRDSRRCDPRLAGARLQPPRTQPAPRRVRDRRTRAGRRI